MSFTENIAYAWKSAVSNKKRAFLTMIGIIVGLWSVLLIVSVGDVLSYIAQEYFISYSLGGNVIAVVSKDKENADNEKYQFTPEEIDRFIDYKPECIYDLQRNSEISYSGKGYTSDSHFFKLNVSGVSMGMEKLDNMRMKSGKFISENECKNQKNVIVISDVSAACCFGSPENALGKKINLDLSNNDQNVYTECIVIGVYEYVDQTDNLKKCLDKRMYETDAYMPYSYVNNISDLKFNNTSVIKVVLKDLDSGGEALNYINEFMNSRFLNDSNYSFEIADASEDLSDIKLLVTLITIIFSLIAGISLIVGGIGLMNTMLISVTERTKEIGIRKALGASNNIIRMQFVLESVILCLIACFIGFILGIISCIIIEYYVWDFVDKIDNVSLKYFISTLNIHINPSSKSVIISILFSLLTGVAFGYYPANKGAKMQPVEALRYE